MNRFESLNRALEIIEEMKKNIVEMMDIEIKSQLILRKMSYGKEGCFFDMLKAPDEGDHLRFIYETRGD